MSVCRTATLRHLTGSEVIRYVSWSPSPRQHAAGTSPGGIACEKSWRVADRDQRTTRLHSDSRRSARATSILDVKVRYWEVRPGPDIQNAQFDRSTIVSVNIAQQTNLQVWVLESEHSGVDSLAHLFPVFPSSLRFCFCLVPSFVTFFFAFSLV